MGLDMWTIRRRKGTPTDGSWNNQEELKYWRKANQIHKWFVDNVQGGIDDCGYYEVTKEKVEELYELCKKVVDEAILEDGQIKTSEEYKNGQWVQNYAPGKVITNFNYIGALLPTGSGFFFGSTEYDEWYLDQVKTTRDNLEHILNTFDFENEYIVYTSSW